MAAFTVSDFQDGSSSHITMHLGKLDNVIAYKGLDKIMVGNGNDLDISHIDSACFGCAKDNEKFTFH